MSYDIPKRRLPDGRLANSRERYLRAWQEVAAPVCEATGWKLAAFDPDIRLTSPEMVGTVNLSVEFVLLLNEALAPKKRK